MNEEKEMLEDEEITPKLCFIRLIGEESDGYYRYEFIFTDNEDDVWGENWDVIPCCLVNDLKPFEEYVYEVHIVKMKIKLMLIQDNCCFGMQDCLDGGVALALQDIRDLDEYPSDGRLFFNFAETLDDVERKLAMKNILMLN